jgi:Bacteriophage tail sheath protein
MAAFTFPGVYIQEIPSGVHTISGVATSIAAFVGWADQGPIDEATLVLSWSDFANQFGGLDPRSYLGYVVNQFFANGGQQAYIVRLVSDATGGNTAAAPASLTITGLTFNPAAVGPPPTPPSLTIVTGGAGGLTLSAANPGVWGQALAVQIQLRPDPLNPLSRFTLNVFYTDPTTQISRLVETFPNLSLSPTDPQYVVNIVNEQSNYLTVPPMGAPALTLPAVPAGTLPSPASPNQLLNGSASDGTVLNPGTKAGGAGAFENILNTSGALNASATLTGVHLLDAVPFDILSVPGEGDPSTISALQGYCVSQRAFLLVDSDVKDTVLSLQNGPDSLMTGTNAKNAAFYFPWVNAFDPIQSMTRAFPPAGFVAGIYAATDASRNVWKAPAGIDASLTGESGLAVILTDAQNGVLNPQAVNCLRNFPVYGDVVWGARTMQGNDLAGSEWKYVPIRRFALFLESSLYGGTQWVVFEPNDERLWGQIRLNVGAFMQGLFLQGAFQGTTPQQAYFVKCDGENNPQSSIDQGVVNILVGFAPLYPAEFVVIQIQQMAGQL